MPAPMKLLQPTQYDDFHCIGADCEDTCCDGWGITVDRLTYAKYQECPDAELRPALQRLVTISPSNTGDDDYAAFKLTETHCPFLSGGLCSIQSKLGEDYLSNTCATYPRIMNLVGGTLERTLDLSCPEAARVILLHPASLEFLEATDSRPAFRIGNPSVPDSPDSNHDGAHPHFYETRNLVEFILRDPSHLIWQRLLILGHFCDKLNETLMLQDDANTVNLVQSYRLAVQNHSFDDLLRKTPPNPTTQLLVILELIVSRITTDFTGRHFLDCYREFMEGLEWTQESGLTEITSRYAEAFSSYFTPLMALHPFLQERYLVNYVYKNLFPFGRLETNRRSGLHHIRNSVSIQCVLLVAYYAIIRTVLIGMARFHKSAFGIGQAIKLIHSCTKAFQHSTTFPLRAIEILNRNGLQSAASTVLLVRDPSVPA